MIKRHPLISFFVMTFAITWVIFAFIIVFPALLLPLLVLAIWAPNISGLVLTGVIGGRSGLRELMGRALKWRVGWRWYLVPLVLVPTISILAAVVNASFGGENTGTTNFQNWFLVLPLLLATIVVDPGPLGEELGWRGFALPRLLDNMGALPASVLVGFFWGIWHLPAWFVPALPQSGFPLPVFIAWTIAISVLMTWVYRSTGGSILVGGFLIHLTSNFYSTNIGPPLTLDTLFLCAVVIVVVVVVGPALISRKPEKRVT